MCGRARCTLRSDDFRRACHLDGRPVRHQNMDRYRPSHNVAPGFNVPVVRRDDEGDGGGAVLHCMKWGLIPSFTKKTEKIDHFRMFNARSESIREKASFRRLLPKNRCLVSVEGFYEWKKDGSRKQPYYIHFKDGRPLVFAALFDSWENAEGEVLYTFTICTTSSSSSLEWLHDRMPVILGNKESTDCWLNDSSLSNFDKILKPYEDEDLAWYPVTSAMGKLSFDGPECIKEVKTEESKTISQFFSKKVANAPQKPNLEKSPVKEELAEASEAISVKEEHESQPTLDSTRLKDEDIENYEQKSVKEEPEINQDDYPKLIIKKDDAENTSNISSIEKKDTREMLHAHAKPFAKETERQNVGPAKKRSKTANDKQQPTLFSYFGRS
ncbi:hypothetical protein ABFX02_14G059900 [Erythranthe guttata]